MQLNQDELQYIVNAIDTYVRNNGLSVAVVGVSILAKIQSEMEANRIKKSSDKEVR